MYNKLNDGAFVNYVNSFDFVCLSETFIDESFNFSRIFTEFVKFTALAKKLSHFGRNSGGVVLFIKKCLEHFVEEIKLECNNAVAVKLSKTVLETDKDVVVVGCYIAPEGSPVYNNTELEDGVMMLEESVLHAVRQDDVHLMIFGDLNARTGSCQAKCEEMVNFESNFSLYCDDFEQYSSRHSKDETENNFGKSLLDLCFSFDLDIMNGFCDGDRDGEYTFVSPQVQRY